MPYVMFACRRCDALITDGIDPCEHGPEDERCYGARSLGGGALGLKRVELFTVAEVAAIVRGALAGKERRERS